MYFQIEKNNKNSTTGDINSGYSLYEFFDYNCGYCKRAHNEIKKLLGRNKNIKVVYKNLPILSERSAFLAKLSLAVGLESQNDFSKFHDFIYKTMFFRNTENMVFEESSQKHVFHYRKRVFHPEFQKTWFLLQKTCFLIHKTCFLQKHMFFIAENMIDAATSCPIDFLLFINPKSLLAE